MQARTKNIPSYRILPRGPGCCIVRLLPTVYQKQGGRSLSLSLPYSYDRLTLSSVVPCQDLLSPVTAAVVLPPHAWWSRSPCVIRKFIILQAFQSTTLTYTAAGQDGLYFAPKRQGTQSRNGLVTRRSSGSSTYPPPPSFNHLHTLRAFFLSWLLIGSKHCSKTSQCYTAWCSSLVRVETRANCAISANTSSRSSTNCEGRSKRRYGLRQAAVVFQVC